MKPIRENVVIQIEITNACHLSCANCSRLVGHHAKPFFMTLDEVRNAIDSLKGFPGRIGMMGGEPTVHPKFKEICDIYQEMVPDQRKRELWTSGYKWSEYREKIYETFDEDLVHYNDHSKPDEGWHQPILISINEMIDDKEKMWKLINNCWLQRRWSASITPKGAFFCEVAGALDHALGGKGGWPVEKGWWKKDPAEYKSQKEANCLRCSAPLPLASIPNNHVSFDYISESNEKLLSLNNSPKHKQGRTRVTSKKDATAYLESVDELVEGERGYWKSHPDWRPSEFRTKVWHSPGEGNLTHKEVAKLHRNSTAPINEKGVSNQIVAEIRSNNSILNDDAVEVASKELRPEIIDAIREHALNEEFVNEESLVYLINECLEEKLSVRERDLIYKYAVDPAFR